MKSPHLVKQFSLIEFKYPLESFYINIRRLNFSKTTPSFVNVSRLHQLAQSMLPTSHVDAEPREPLGLFDMVLGWLVLIVGQAGVGTLQVELDCQVPLLRQYSLASQH